MSSPDEPTLRPSSPPASARMPQRLLNRYEVERVLGRGAMGEVLLVRDLQSGARYALKRVPPEVAHDQSSMRLVRHNFALVSGLTHPHIAATRFFEVDESAGQAYLIMDLVEGPTLADWVVKTRIEKYGDPKHPLPLPVVLGMAEQIAMALDYAHSQPLGKRADGTPRGYGILHRDLKPSNVMVEEGREFRPGVPYLKLVDFGMAAEIQASMHSRSMTQGNQVCGTPFYMSPEQWEGRTLTRAVDQWALAVMIYEWVSGRRPFEAPTSEALERRILAANPDRVELLGESSWLVIKRAFSADRQRRFHSCLEFVHSLANADSATLGQIKTPAQPIPSLPEAAAAPAQPVSQPVVPTPSVPAPQPAPSRGSGVLALVAVLLLLVLAGGGYYFWQENEKAKEAARQEEIRRAHKKQVDEALGLAGTKAEKPEQLQAAIGILDGLLSSAKDWPTTETQEVRKRRDEFQLEWVKYDIQQAVDAALRAPVTENSIESALQDLEKAKQRHAGVAASIVSPLENTRTELESRRALLLFQGELEKQQKLLTEPSRYELIELETQKLLTKYDKLKPELLQPARDLVTQVRRNIPVRDLRLALGGLRPQLQQASRMDENIDALKKLEKQYEGISAEAAPWKELQSELSRIQQLSTERAQRLASFAQMISEAEKAAPTNAVAALEKLDEAEKKASPDPSRGWPDLGVGLNPTLEQRKQSYSALKQNQIAQKASSEFEQLLQSAKAHMAAQRWLDASNDAQKALIALGTQTHVSRREASEIIQLAAQNEQANTNFLKLKQDWARKKELFKNNMVSVNDLTLLEKSFRETATVEFLKSEANQIAGEISSQLNQYQQEKLRALEKLARNTISRLKDLYNADKVAEGDALLKEVSPQLDAAHRTVLDTEIASVRAKARGESVWEGDVKILRWKDRELVVGAKGAALQNYPWLGYAESTATATWFWVKVRTWKIWMLYDSTNKEYLSVEQLYAENDKTAAKHETNDRIAKMVTVKQKNVYKGYRVRQYGKENGGSGAMYYNEFDYETTNGEKPGHFIFHHPLANIDLEWKAREIPDEYAKKVIADHEAYWGKGMAGE